MVNADLDDGVPYQSAGVCEVDNGVRTIPIAEVYESDNIADDAVITLVNADVDDCVLYQLAGVRQVDDGVCLSDAVLIEKDSV